MGASVYLLTLLLLPAHLGRYCMSTTSMVALTLLLLCALASVSGGESNNAADQHTPYGVDVSIPIHHHGFRDDDPSLSDGGSMAHRRRFYWDFMNTWKQHLIMEGQDPSEADEAEQDRIQGNLEQPAIVVNYTSTGYLKVTAPKEVSDTLSQFWESNKHLQEEEVLQKSP